MVVVSGADKSCVASAKVDMCERREGKENKRERRKKRKNEEEIVELDAQWETPSVAQE